MQYFRDITVVKAVHGYLMLTGLIQAWSSFENTDNEDLVSKNSSW